MDPPILLNLPLELRLLIFEPLLFPSTPSKTTPNGNPGTLTFSNTTLGPLPRCLQICGQLRDELSYIYFLHRTVHFSTFGEMATCLHLAPSTVPFWRNVRIELPGRRMLTALGKRWHLEPGLALLSPSITPRLTRVSLDVGEIVVGPESYAQTVEFEREVMWCVDQVRAGLPQGQVGPGVLEVVGTAVRRDTVFGRKIVAGTWSVGFERTRGRDDEGWEGWEWEWKWFCESGF